MAKGKEEKRKSKKSVDNIHQYELKTMISDDQREYIEGVREWLHDSLHGKGKIVGGTIS